MSCRILRYNSNGMLGTDGCCLSKDGISDACFDLFDLLDSLLFIETVDEQIDIGCRCESLVIVGSQGSLGIVVGCWNGDQSSHRCGSCNNDI